VPIANLESRVSLPLPTSQFVNNVRHTKRSQDIRGNQIEHTGPRCGAHGSTGVDPFIIADAHPVLPTIEVEVFLLLVQAIAGDGLAVLDHVALSGLGGEDGCPDAGSAGSCGNGANVGLLGSPREAGIVVILLEGDGGIVQLARLRFGVVVGVVNREARVTAITGEVSWSRHNCSGTVRYVSQSQLQVLREMRNGGGGPSLLICQEEAWIPWRERNTASSTGNDGHRAGRDHEREGADGGWRDATFEHR
jgi:hypothetical protein